MKDAVATMGTVLTDDVGGRDAVHVAVIAARAGHPIIPGAHVGLRAGSVEPDLIAETKGDDADCIGIVDPFLQDRLKKGQRFWLYLYPRTITSLRHNWTHPKFADAQAGTVYARPTDRASSEAWLRDFIVRSDCPSYETVVSVAIGEGGCKQWSDEYLHFDGMDAHGDLPSEFWDHIEIVTGHKIPHDRRPKYFSCSC